jgi:hypothetical protein
MSVRHVCVWPYAAATKSTSGIQVCVGFAEGGARHVNADWGDEIHAV